MKAKPNPSYTTWPLFTVAFIKTFANAIYSLALPNYLIYVKEMSPSLVGTISSATAIAYIFGPIFGNKIKSFIGIRKSIIFSSIMPSVFIVLQLVFFVPWVLITTRILDGIIIGMFWPNLLNQISNWQKKGTSEQSEKNFKNFNKSWSYGLITGFLTGYIIVSFLSDYLAIIISLGIGVFMIPISFLCKDEAKFESSESEIVVGKEIVECASPSETKYPAAIFPIALSWIGIIVMTSSKAIFSFTLPFFLSDAEWDSQWVYLITVLTQTLQ